MAKVWILGVALVASACTSSGAPTTSTVPEAPSTTVAATTTTRAPTTTTSTLPSEPVHGGTVKIGISAFTLSTTLNPLVEPYGTSDIARLVVPGAFRIDAATGELTPWLVERIPRLGDGVEVADDGTVTVTYRVRDEAVWEDGTPVTGVDLAFTHKLILANADNMQEGFIVETNALIDTESIQVDGKTFTADLVRSDPAYETLFEWVLPAHLIDADTFLDDWNDNLWPSAGPFRFVSFELDPAFSTEPSIVTLERNPNYWETDPLTGDALPYLDGVEFYAFGGGLEPADEATWLKTGPLDAEIRPLIGPRELVDVYDIDELGLEVVTDWDILYEVLVFNLEDGRFDINPESRNELIEYRMAVLAAIDRQQLAETFEKREVNSITGVAVDRYDNDAWDAYAYDDASRVGDLLAGVSEPHFAVYTSSHGEGTITFGTAVAEQLTAAGIDTTTDFDGDFFFSRLPERSLDLYAFRAFASVGGGGLSGVARALELFDPDREAVFWSPLTEDASRYRLLIAEARSELDQDRLGKLLAEAESILADNAVLYPLVRRNTINIVYWPERIQGLVPNRHSGWDTWNAATWWSPGG
jgi:ABC-type transport system substrate-binding protein